MNASVVLALATALSAQAQSWCPPGAEWTFDFTTDVGGQTGVVRVEYDGDSLIDGSTVQRLRQWAHVLQPGSGYSTWARPSLFTRSNTDVVELYDPVQQDFDTLMWFGAQPGEHWTFPDWGGSTWTITAEATSTIVVDGVSLRQLVVSGQPAFWSGTDTLTERAGFHTVYILPIETLVPEGYARDLRCYRDDGISFSPTPVPDCGFTVGIGSVAPAQEVAAYPNPGHDHFSLQLPVLGGTLDLYDPQGRQLQRLAALGHVVRVDARDLSPGVYAYRVVDRGGSIISMGRWVKQ